MKQTSRFKSNGSEERRGYARVLDAVGLEIRRLELGEAVDLHGLKNNKAELPNTWQPYADIEALRVIDPDAAKHIEHLEAELHRACKVRDASNLVSEAPTHKVSLSGSGIAFAHNLVLQPGDNVVLGLTLFPSQEYFEVLAMVISVGGASGSFTGGKHAARAIFVDIDADTREQVVQHIEFVKSEM